MKILHLVPYYSSAWAYGGIPRIVTGLTRALAKAGHEISVLTTDVEGPRRKLPPSGVEEGVNIHYFPNSSRYLASRYQFFTPRGLSHFLRDHVSGFDLVHIHGCHHLLGVLAYPYLKKAGIPYLISPYGTAPRIEQHLWAKFVFDRIFWDKVFSQSDHYHALSRFEEEQLGEMGIPAGKITVIYPGLNLDEFADLPSKGEMRRRYRINDSEKVILYLGRISPRKGIEHVFQACALMRQKAFRLVIAGNDCGYQSHLQSLSRSLGISDRVVFTGLLSGRERLSAYVDADLVVYPSTLEAFGLVPCEAVLCGTPVAYTREAGCAEIMEQIGAGTGIEYGDIKGLSESIVFNLGQNSVSDLKESLQNQLDWDALIIEMIRIYEEIQAGKAGEQQPGTGGLWSGSD